jgi:hypothetical protein
MPTKKSRPEPTFTFTQPTHVPYIIPPPTQKKSRECLHVVFSPPSLSFRDPLVFECSHHMDQQSGPNKSRPSSAGNYRLVRPPPPAAPTAKQPATPFSVRRSAPVSSDPIAAKTAPNKRLVHHNSWAPRPCELI